MENKPIEQKPRVGIGVLIFKEGKILLGKRKGSHGEGEYASPGGHLEYLETIEECSQREVKEECGLEIKNIHFQFLANVRKYAPKHYVHIGVIADWAGGEPRTLEPEKCESWNWYEPENPPQPLFEMCRLSLESYLKGEIYYDM